MSTRMLIFALFYLSGLQAQIRLHPQNQHYFEHQGKPRVLVASGEHYGSVINLDFTFQVGQEDGSGSTEFTCDWYAGCTDPQMKFQLAALLKFMHSIDFSQMKPDFQAVALNYGDENIYPLVWEGNIYAVYFEGGRKAKIKLNIPPGQWRVKWLQPVDLKVLSEETTEIQHGTLDLMGPAYEADLLLVIERDNP